nr:MAG TPA: hypothetical protein [Caudoviricetes sp.]
MRVAPSLPLWAAQIGDALGALDGLFVGAVYGFAFLGAAFGG